MDILQYSLEAPEEPSIPLRISSLKTEDENPKQLIITKISQAVKNPNRVNIFINEKYSFSLNLSQMTDYKIRTGMNLTKDEIKEFQHLSEFGKLYQHTLEWVLTRPRSRKEVYDHLKRRQRKRSLDNLQIQRNHEQKQDDEYFGRKSYKSHEDFRGQNSSYEEDNRPKFQSFRQRIKALPEIRDEDIAEVLRRLDSYNYLDDRKYAEFFVGNRYANKGVSTRVLRIELKSKGVDEDIISEVLENSDRNDQDEMRKIIDKKRGKYDDKKLLAYLMRKGFTYEMAKSAIEEDNK